ncbi:F-box domain-containing protein [Meloidogyne graminicola]|uniref:F-box domain-containing protein n=1 Tax=Meloidogyne graminicola TaxID=189291 RepID=A0A8S9ZX94_9BILA|nr:F-box domain-containing protein [Meloidogyne graminicola]
MQFHDLSPEILKRIFEFLEFHERIRIERVSKDWKNLCWNWAWLDCQDLRFSRKDLFLTEDWKDSDEINRKIEELNVVQTTITRQLIKERNCPKFECKLFM